MEAIGTRIDHQGRFDSFRLGDDFGKEQALSLAFELGVRDDLHRSWQYVYELAEDGPDMRCFEGDLVRGLSRQEFVSRHGSCDVAMLCAYAMYDGMRVGFFILPDENEAYITCPAGTPDSAVAPLIQMLEDSIASAREWPVLSESDVS